MAARPTGASPPALKIKLKRRDPPALPNSNADLKQGETPFEEDGKLLDAESSRTGSLKRKLPSPLPSSPASKRSAREQSPPSPIPLSASGQPLEVFPGRSQQLSKFPLVTLHKLGQPHISVTLLCQRDEAIRKHRRLEDEGQIKPTCAVLENISHGQLQIVSVVPSNQPFSTEQDDTDLVSGGPADAAINQQLPPCILPRSLTQCYKRSDKTIIPKHAGWFSWDHIHKLERQGLPHFFFGKSRLQSPHLYIDVRNTIIHRYRKDPEHFLKLDDIKGLKDFDEKDLEKILYFLSNWGLINYQVQSDLKMKSQNFHAKFTASMLENELGQLQLLPLPFEHLESLHQFDTQVTCVNVAVNSCQPTCLTEITDPTMFLQGSGTRYTCSVCNASYSGLQFCCEKQEGFVLCSDCYGDGNFGIGMTASDFMLSNGKIESPDSSEGPIWTDQETFMLLEALELYGENWMEVSEFIGSKSKAQCIQQFISLSIDDRFLEDIEITKDMFLLKDQGPSCSSVTSTTLQSKEKYIGDSVSECLLGKASDQNSGVRQETTSLLTEPVVFAEAGNPVMALVAFLAATVGPRVAAAAAHTALLSLSADDWSMRSASERAMADLNARYQDAPFGGQTLHGTLEGASVSLLSATTCQQGARNIQSANHQLEAKSSISSEVMKRAIAAALAAAAVKAKLLADLEEREIQRLTAFVVDNQLRKLDMKLKQLEEIDPALESQCEQIEKNRVRLSNERARLVGGMGNTAVSSQMPISGTTSLIRAAGPITGSTMPGTILPVHSTGMLRPTLFTMGPGGVAMPVSASMMKSPP